MYAPRRPSTVSWCGPLRDHAAGRGSLEHDAVESITSWLTDLRGPVVGRIPGTQFVRPGTPNPFPARLVLTSIRLRVPFSARSVLSVTLRLALSPPGGDPVNDQLGVATSTSGLLYFSRFLSHVLIVGGGGGGRSSGRVVPPSNSKYPFLAALAFRRRKRCLRGIDRLRLHHRSLVRRAKGIAQSFRVSSRRQRTTGWVLLGLVLAAALPDVRDLPHLGAGRGPPPPFDLVEAAPSWSPASWWNNRNPPPPLCSCSANPWAIGTIAPGPILFSAAGCRRLPDLAAHPVPGLNE